MPTDRFYIGPYDSDSGLQNNYKPFAIPDSAFARIDNAYVFRGRVRKRFGSKYLGDTNSQLLSRFRVLVTTSDGGGTASGMVPAGSGAIGQMFSIGTEIFTVISLGTPAVLIDTGSASTMTFNTSTGAFVFTGVAALTDVYWYPALPVMGLVTFQNSATGNEACIGFDTKYAYSYSGGWNRISGETNVGDATWKGNNLNFFWGASYNAAHAFDYALFVTNFNKAETPNFMRYLFNNTWTTFRPLLSLYSASPLVAGIYLDAAAIIVPFKNRLLAFNTWESSTVDNITYTQNNYPNRLRYSGLGSPIDNPAFPTAPGAPNYYPWRNISGFGGGIDCPINQAIVTVEFIKDRLIVFMENSTWEIVFTGNQVQPFAWQQINTELGAASTFSIVPFDKIAVGVAYNGIHACNGANVERIDNKIPSEVFNIFNSDMGTSRVYGIRDYFVEMVYWTFPSQDTSAVQPYPNRVLTYDYTNGAWAFNDDSITAFGYFQPVTGITWDSLVIKWDSDMSWDSGTQQPQFRQVIAGNQEGYTFLVDPDLPTNASVLQITNITIAVAGSNNVTITCIDHNLRAGDYVLFSTVNPGFTVFDPALVATVGVNLTATYNNGVAGVGATLTNAGPNALFSLDGVNPPLNARILIKNQTSSFQNGLYIVTTIGSSLVPWVLTRSPDYNMAPSQIFPGNFFPVSQGTVNAGTYWQETATVTTIGTDAITFASTANLFSLLNNRIFQVLSVLTVPNTFNFIYSDANNTILTGTYKGGGTLARVSQIDILTKQYNFYLDKGRNASVSKVDFLVDTTASGEIQVDYLVSTANVSMVTSSSGLGTNCIVGTNILETVPYPDVPFESTASQVWHPVYFQADGEFIQLRLYLNDTEMTTSFFDENGLLTGPTFVDFQLHAIMIHASPTASRLQ